ncbi:pimeloyl-ACP methyl ester carboxylesterase [Micromonospora pisi]|uniref:Pimeloyl-ACP methyl ester carboxylesterase n=1 Tax=Micromonospora pisi TaxID=589240 RepID=A0A495JE09_9ACTN|nr:alpha/beta hydrolase [Micromonospora pisi]RKR87240.1 pimeloyl-ACP methyl ester carboxylesterase [Micromonospora pisi]
MSLVAEAHGSGLPMLCLPGFSLARSAMVAAMEPAVTASSALRRIYLDLPGTGQSPGGPADSDGVVDWVGDFVDREIGSEPFLIAGWSYGGYLAAALARRRPEQVAGLLLICHGTRILRTDRDVPTAPVVPEDAEWLADVPPDLRAHLSVALGNRTLEAAGRVATVLVAAGTGDEEYLERLRENGYQLSDEGSTMVYPGPTSIIAGRHDYIAGYADQFRALASYPSGSYAALAEAGHYLPFEQPEAFRGLTLDWLARCTAALGVAPLDYPAG